MALNFLSLCFLLAKNQVMAALENIIACKLPDRSTFDADGIEVDWFVLQKLPKSASYVYISPQSQAEASGNDIGNNESPVMLTLDSFFKLEATQPLQPTQGKKDIYRNQLLQLFYGCNEAKLSENARYSRSKGVIIAQPAISNRVRDGGAGTAHPEGMLWMTHTVPSFPDVNKPVWNPQNNNEGHLFLCLSMEVSHLSSLLETLHYEQPFVYHSNYPKYAFENETLLERFNRVSKMKYKLHSVYIASIKVTTTDGVAVSIISENYKLAAGDAADFSLTLAEVCTSDIASSWITAKFQASFYSWNRRSTNDIAQIRDCCGNFKVENLIGPITMAGTKIQHSEDNSRWIVSLNGKIFEKVSGGAVCICNTKIANWFKQAMQSSSIQRC